MASPAFSINGTAVSLGSVSVPAGLPVTATLLSTADVDSVQWTMVRADELTDPAVDYTLVQSGSVGQTVTFTALAALSAATLQCTVNNGVDKTTGDPSDAMTATGKFYVPGGVTGFTEVGVAGELEDTNREASPTHGAIAWINEMVRAASVYVGPPVGSANYFYQSDGTAVPVWHSYAAFGAAPPTIGSQRWSDHTTVRGLDHAGTGEAQLMDWGDTTQDHLTLGSNSANLDGVDIVAGAAGEFDVRVGAATNLRVAASAVTAPSNPTWNTGTGAFTCGGALTKNHATDQFAAAVVNPTIGQVADTTVGGVMTTLAINGRASNVAGSTGGPIAITAGAGVDTGGYLLLGSGAGATAGLVAIDVGGTRRLNCYSWGDFEFNAQLVLATALVNPSFYQYADATAAVTCDNLTFTAQAASNAVGGASAGRSGVTVLAAPVHGGHADNYSGSVALIEAPATNPSVHGMELGLYIGAPAAGTAPTLPPATGWYQYTDPVSGNLCILGTSNTLTTVALP